MNTTKRARAVALLVTSVAVTLGLTACGGSSENQGGASSTTELSGDVKIDGSSTVGPLSKAAADLFSEEQPKVKATVGISGTGGGFKKFCNGEIDVSDASRPIKDAEKKECADKGISFTELTIANDALTIVVNKTNTWAQCLTTAQLKKMWEPGSTVTNWNQVDPTFPNEPLKLFGAGTDSGTFDYFTNAINGKEKASRTDYTPSEDDNIVVQGVSGSKGGLGYFGFTYFEENADKIKAVKIDSGQGCVEPTKETAQRGTYTPLSRPLYIYVSDVAAKRAQVHGFIDFYINNIDNIVKEAKFVPLTAEQKNKLATDYAAFREA